MRKVNMYHCVPDTAKVFENLHFEKGSEEEELALDLFEEAKKIAAPKSIYDVVAVEHKEKSVVIGDVEITYPHVCEKLQKTSRAIPYIVTCGTELEEWSKKMGDPLEEFVADSIKLAFLYTTMLEFRAMIKETYFPTGYLAALNPGSLKLWPLPEQKKLFMIFGEENVKNEIGVELTPSFLMLPSKSSSGIFFASEETYENCMLCPLLKCPNRRAPFSGKTE